MHIPDEMKPHPEAAAIGDTLLTLDLRKVEWGLIAWLLAAAGVVAVDQFTSGQVDAISKMLGL